MRRLEGLAAAGRTAVLGKMVSILAAVALLVLSSAPAGASPTNPAQAEKIVKNWLAQNSRPLGASMAQAVKEVQTFRDGAGNAVYYVVYLNPQGLVIVSADDLVEPIVAFLARGSYDPSPANPLGALVSRDLPARLAAVRDRERQATLEGLKFTPPRRMARARGKWARFASSPSAAELETVLPGNPSDLRVAPLLGSKWSQGDVGIYHCYNYFTPNNYVCGCVATAMAQLMYFWGHPTAGVGTGAFTITVNGVSRLENLKGGDNAGGPYHWADMVLDPLSGSTDAQRQAIGYLTHDAGAAVNMEYTSDASGAYTEKIAPALRSTFQYQNARWGGDFFGGVPTIPIGDLNRMMNPNLDAGHPVILTIADAANEGHAIVADGYGYDAGSLYHHLNMGWAGTDDAWYNLPNIDCAVSHYNFTIIDGCIYNVFTSWTESEIISGRVTDASGAPLAGAAVSAVHTGGGTYNGVTDALGIYSLAHVPSNSSYTVSAAKTGYSFAPLTVSTGKGIDNTTTSGNCWGVNFVSGLPPLGQALDNNQLTFTTGGNASWLAETSTRHWGGSAAQSGPLSDLMASRLETTVVGPGRLSFFWKVSSEQDYDFLKFYLDGSAAPAVPGISGETDWQPVTVSIPAGTHTVRWEYSKDDYVSEGQDCGWVDKVVYTRAGFLPSIFSLLLD